MRDRSLASSCALATIAALMSLASVAVPGQSAPDLQGIWISSSATPLERPKTLEGRQFLTDREVNELKKRADRIFKNSGSDFPGGDAVFLAALANVDQFALTQDGERRRAALLAAALRADPEGPEDLNNARRCLTFGTPRLGGNYGAGPYSYYEIVQTPRYVLLYMEYINETRIIPLDGRPHLPPSIRQWNGDSRGRWEGDVLVVDTINFSPHASFMGSAENLHLVERFTRVAPDRIDYRITLDDPTTWTKPWTAVIRLRRTQEKIYEVACHEGNHYSMQGVLAGARAQEKAAGEAAKKRR